MRIVHPVIQRNKPSSLSVQIHETFCWHSDLRLMGIVMTYRARSLVLALILSLTMWAALIQGAVVLFSDRASADPGFTASIQ